MKFDLRLLFLTTACLLAGCSSDVTRFDGLAYELGAGPVSTASLAPVEQVDRIQEASSSYVGGKSKRALQNDYRPGHVLSNQDQSIPEVKAAQVASLEKSYAPQRSQQYTAQPVSLNKFSQNEGTRNPAAQNVPAPFSDQPPTAQLAKMQAPVEVKVAALPDVVTEQSGGVAKLDNNRIAQPRKINVIRINPQTSDVWGAEGKVNEQQVVVNGPISTPSSGKTQSLAKHRVAAGETLYAISRKHNVPLNALKTTNKLENNNIKVGQTLVLPGKRAIVAKAVHHPQKQSQPVKTAKVVKDNNINSGETLKNYIVAPGDTIYGIARRHGVSPAALMAVNEMDDINALKVGQTLHLPVGKMAVLAEQQVQKKSYPLVREKTVAAAKPKLVKTAIKQPTIVSSGFMWPVKGQIIKAFGKSANGQRNDGVNLLVPAGTIVKASQGGVVAYAGNELKGYGNLILIRHKNNWITAYAHNSELLVRRGQKVVRGQDIAKSGSTGSVSKPQVHFELRRGADPVDPQKHIGAREMASR